LMTQNSYKSTHKIDIQFSPKSVKLRANCRPNVEMNTLPPNKKE
jgi:hypothetical protein